MKFQVFNIRYFGQPLYDIEKEKEKSLQFGRGNLFNLFGNNEEYAKNTSIQLRLYFLGKDFSSI